jgi:hypothetical protein
MGKYGRCVLMEYITHCTDATVTRLTARTENAGHRLYMYNSTPELCEDFVL